MHRETAISVTRTSPARRLAALGAFLTAMLAVTSPLAAAPDSPGQLRRIAVERLAIATEADGRAHRRAREMLGSAGFPLPAVPGLVPLAPRGEAALATDRFDLRIALGLLAQAFGHDDNSAVLDAQEENGVHAVIVERGSLGLADLTRIMGTGAVAQGNVVELHAPLILWHDAELHLNANEVLQLSRRHGAFILNFGRLIVDGAGIHGVGTQSPYNEEFAPFITTSGPGTMQMRNAQISDLGFGGSVKYSGLSVARSALDRPAAASFIIDSVIERVQRISIQAASNLTIDNNRIIDAGSAALVVQHSRNTTISANIITGKSNTNAIRVLDGAVGTVLAGNAILKGDRAGILIKQAADNTLVKDNIVWARGGGGIKVDRASCTEVIGNFLISNRQKGIEVRRSLDAYLAGNYLVDNKSAGIWVSGQPKRAVTRIAGNVLDSNGSGIATATAAAVLLEGNDFSAQFPKFFSGDLSPQARFVAADVTGETPIALDAAGPVPITDLVRNCESAS